MNRWLGCAFVVAFAACGLFPNLAGLSGQDASTTDAPLPDVNADVADATQASDASDGGTCTGTAGPTPVPAGAFCIDSTEVTNAEYAAFYATNPSFASLPPLCVWKTTFLPTYAAPANEADYPVAWVDWCDAWAYCKWAGKRLCGATTGGAIAATGLNTLQDQWFVACSHADSTAFPYGGTFDPKACNGPERDAGTPLPASLVPNCVGGYPGIFNMVENIDEWVDSCADGTDGGRLDQCQRRGGSYQDPDGSVAACNFARTNTRNFADLDQGFRCCSDLQ